MRDIDISVALADGRRLERAREMKPFLADGCYLPGEATWTLDDDVIDEATAHELIRAHAARA